MTVQELKKALIGAGLEVYRARGDEVQLAERPRENLIMEAGVSVVMKDAFHIRFVVRAQRADFQGEDDDRLFDRARRLAAECLSRGYVELRAAARPMHDPGDASRVLDTWCEVWFEKIVPDLEEALREASFVIKLEKSATRLPCSVWSATSRIGRGARLRWSARGGSAPIPRAEHG